LNLNNEEGIANAIHEIGILYAKSGDFKEGLKFLQEALVKYEKINNSWGITYCLLDIGEVYRQVELTDKALQFFERGLLLFNEKGYVRGKEYILNIINDLKSKQNPN
jgi:tetratricopeptide (TPR) repeat protein